MGSDSLDLEDEKFYEGMAELIIIVVKKDDTVNIKTTVQDMHELQSIFNTGIMMASFHHIKSLDPGVDKLH